MIQAQISHQMTVDEGRPIGFAHGLVGIPGRKWFTVSRMSDGPFCVLQNIDDAQLRFAVVDPRHFLPGFEIPAHDGEKEQQLLVTCRVLDGWLVGNLMGPIVIDTIDGVGRQLVLTDGKWSTRQRLMQLSQEGVI